MRYILFVILFSLRLSVDASILAGPVTNTANGHIYYLLSQNTWSNAEAEAVSLGGHLATVRSEAENSWIFQTFSTFGGEERILWIGLSDRDKKFHFTWSSGESVSYTAWATDEPNNGAQGEDFVAIYFFPYKDQRGKWNDFGERDLSPRGLPINGVMEVIPKISKVSRATQKLQLSPKNQGTSLGAAVPQSSESLQPVEIRPSLVVTSDSRSIKLQWAISESRYMLEATTDLAEPFSMFGYSETTNEVTGVISATITNPGPRMFFRLRKP